MDNHQFFLEEELKKIDEDYELYEADKTYCMDVYNHMKEHMDECLKNRQYDRMLELSQYFDSIKSYPKFHMTAEIYRINILLIIVRIESRYFGSVPFLSDIDSYDDCMEQYTLSIFAMRRLELALTEQSMQEACVYLGSIHLSAYTAAIIVENELFEKCPRLYMKLYECMADLWTEEEKVFWLRFFAEQYQA
jgi:hypothetical protein